MPWHKVSTEHWQNDSDAHLFWDKDMKCVCVERWVKEPGYTSTVIPIDEFLEFLKDNRYPCLPEAAFVQLRDRYHRFMEANSAFTDIEMELKQSQSIIRKKVADIKKAEFDSQKAFDTALEVGEKSAKKAADEIKRRQAVEVELKQVKESIPKIVALAQGEMSKLKDEIKRLKEKCGET